MLPISYYAEEQRESPRGNPIYYHFSVVDCQWVSIWNGLKNANKWDSYVLYLVDLIACLCINITQGDNSENLLLV